ncbi:MULTISPECIES: STAS domain-containing protein [unclassified Streptomyces]|uniref:STAS domain-containing protein n=1 Tax=unclassified Streptomyces TaxID=2593676 RepID=UPI0036E5E54D
MSTADDDKRSFDHGNGFDHVNEFDQVNGSAQEQFGAVVQYERDGAWVVVAHGSYDMDSLSPLAEALGTAAEKHARVVVDVAGITFADSTFLNLLLGLNRQTELRLVGPPPQLRRILELTGADTVLDVRATVEDAVA